LPSWESPRLSFPFQAGPLKHTAASTDDPQFDQFDAGSRQMGSHNAAVQIALYLDGTNECIPADAPGQQFFPPFSGAPANRGYGRKFNAKWH
jgi:hypothetical protein